MFTESMPWLEWIRIHPESLLSILVFLAVVLLIVGSIQLVQDRMDQQKRKTSVLMDPLTVRHPPSGQKHPRQFGAFLVHWVEPVGELWTPRTGWQNHPWEKKLIQAGYRDRKALPVFIGIKALLTGLVVAAGILLVLLWDPRELLQLQTWLLLAVLGSIGFWIPNGYLHRRREQRKQILQESFPDAMDLLVVCVEAGLGLDMAISRVGEQLQSSHPEMGAEFRIVSLELRAGMSRDKALQGMAERTGLDEVKTLASILIQAEHFGTSIAEALREQSTSMRIARIQKAKERAAKLPVKLIFPIMVFIFPAMFLVILGPAVIRIVESFSSLQ